MPAPKKKETYSQAMERLEKIVRQIDNNELEIDALAEKIIVDSNERLRFRLKNGLELLEKIERTRR